MRAVPCGHLVATLEPRCGLGYGFPGECAQCRAYRAGQSYEEVARCTAWRAVDDGDTGAILPLFSHAAATRALG